MATLSVRLLGPFQVTLDGEAVTGFATDKVRALLAYLVVEADRPHRRESLAGLLWPEYPERSARTSLRSALANLRQVIGDAAASPPYLDISRQTIRLNPEGEVWSDVAAFAEWLESAGAPGAPEDGQEIVLLEEAVDLYRGPFLEGFSLADSPAFEEWALLTRDGFQRQALITLQHLVEHYEGRGDLQRALDCSWRHVALDPWREAAQRGLIRLLALNGQQRAALAQYEAYRRTLAEELGVGPEEETTALYERIRSGWTRPLQLEPPPPSPQPSPFVTPVPAFLTQDAAPRAATPEVFVARERELARLEGFLEEALSGQGKVAFVIGGPGRGKTALLRAFAERAMATRPDLLVALGGCKAYAGVGDPYLPFREALGMLSGEVEERWAAGLITTQHARRLWEVLPKVGHALLERGPFLVNTLVSGKDLLARAEARLAGEANRDWLGELKILSAREQAGPSNLEQSALFTQAANVPSTLAAQHPLLLLLDNLQWTDVGSASLLFHLGQRLADARGRVRVLILGAYRPEEIAVGRPTAEGRGREPHPLEAALTEFKRRFGATWVDLARVPATERRRFVEAYLDSAPNRLGADFRKALFQHTGGHALFTVELLRGMQARGDLVQEGGQWVDGDVLDWSRLPARVEGVIAARLERLDEEIREMLSVASVEGERFTAQVVAEVAGVPERKVLRTLSQELGARHRLVREAGEVRAKGRYLAQYQFAHALFQSYLYDRLSAGERRLLHGEVGAALEALYEPQTDEIAAALAHHFVAAGHRNKAVEYALHAGDQARRAYANEEAIAHYEGMLELLGPAPGTPEQERVWRLEALKGLGHVCMGMGRTLEAEGYIREAIALGKRLGLGAREIVRLHWWLGETLYWQSKLDAFLQNATDGLALLSQESASSDLAPGASAVESVEGALMCGHLAWAHFDKGNWGKATEYARRTAAFILRLPYVQELHSAYAVIAYASINTDKDVAGAMSWLQALEERATAVHDLRALAEASYNKGRFLYWRGDPKSGILQLQRALELQDKLQDDKARCQSLGALTAASFDLGDIQNARDYAHKWLEAAQAVGTRGQMAQAHLFLGKIFVCQNVWEKAERAFQRALEICRGIRVPGLEAQASYALGHVYIVRRERGKAIDAFRAGVSTEPVSILNLSGLERAYADASAFRAFCRRFREAHPEIAVSPTDQWFLEPVTPGAFRGAPGQHERFAEPSALGWVWEDPLGDCSFCIVSRSTSEANALGNGPEIPAGLVGPARLSSPTGLEVRAVNDRDLWYVNLSAPRLLRPTPQGTHWAVQTICEPCSGETPAIGGLLLWKDKRNYLRLVRGYDGPCEITFLGCLENRDLVIGRGWLWVGDVGDGELGNAGVWLRLERIEGRVRSLCSPDGENWFTLGEVDFPVADPVRVGLHASGWINRSVYPGAHPDGTAIRFKSFQMWMAER